MFRLFFISFWVFFVLSLGPILHVNGVIKFTEHDLTVMLPGILTAYLPFFDMIRVPSRYHLMTMFCAAIITAYGIKSIIIKHEFNARKRMLLCILLSVLVLIEFAAVMPNQTIKPIPDFYLNISIEKGDSILELPIMGSNLYNQGHLQYYEYQEIHEAKMFGGYWYRINPIYAQFAQSDPVLHELYIGRNDIYTISTSSILNKLEYLKYNYAVQYVVIHEALLSPEYLDELIQYFGNSYSTDYSVASDPLIIYSTKDIPHKTEYFLAPARISLGDGWHNIENWGSTPTRWIESNATLIIHSNEKVVANLSLNALAFQRPRTMEIYINNHPHIYTKIPNNTMVNVNVPRINLNKGVNIVRFHVPEGCERPCDIPELNNKDPRCISAAVQNIRIIG